MDVTWQRCSSFLRDEMPPQQFNTWIRPLRAQESADELQLIAPNRFVKDWVHDKYIERIRQIVREVSGGRIAHVQLDAAGREAMNVNFELILGQAGDVFRTHNVHACGDR